VTLLEPDAARGAPSGPRSRPVWRVLLVGDDPLARGGLAWLLSPEPDFVVVAQTALADAAAAIERDDPQLAVWDLGAGPLVGLDRLAELAEEGPPALVLLPPPHSDEAGIAPTAGAAGAAGAAEALAAGARGLLFRDTDGDRLATALRALAAGLLVVDETLLPPPAGRPAFLASPEDMEGAADPIDPLTRRETEVLQLLAQGLSNRAIGERLGISEHTAKFHVTSIVAKLGAQTRTDAAVRAARLGLVLL
jgi:DNA-binding NarL/FixJ family response regulator